MISGPESSVEILAAATSWLMKLTSGVQLIESGLETRRAALGLEEGSVDEMVTKSGETAVMLRS